jgi:hypothetical protein
MNREELEHSLSKGYRWGFIKQTSNSNYLGWILLVRRQLPILWPIDKIQRPEYYKRTKQEVVTLTRTPYHIHIVEIRKDVHESGTYNTDIDTHLIENYYFANLDNIEKFLEQYNLELSTIRLAHEIDAP